MFNKNEMYKRGLNATQEKIDRALQEGYDLICNIVKDNGGLLKTPQCEEKPALYAYYEDFDEHGYHESIHGLRWDDELGLCICTNSMLDNYQYDTGYQFEYYYNFEGEDLEHLNKVLDEPAYFVEFDKYDLVKRDTILNLVAGLAEYL